MRPRLPAEVFVGFPASNAVSLVLPRFLDDAFETRSTQSRGLVVLVEQDACRVAPPLKKRVAKGRWSYEGCFVLALLERSHAIARSWMASCLGASQGA